MDIAHVWQGKIIALCICVTTIASDILGGSCSHVAAILFKVDIAVRLNYKVNVHGQVIFNGEPQGSV